MYLKIRLIDTRSLPQRSDPPESRDPRSPSPRREYFNRNSLIMIASANQKLCTKNVVHQRFSADGRASLIRRDGSKRKLAGLLGNLQEKLVALDFLHHQLAWHVGSDDRPEHDLTVTMLVQEEMEKIAQLGELVGEVSASLLRIREAREGKLYIA